MSNADNLRKLREMTSAGMLDCKKALDEANGDIEKAANILREKGIVKAVKKMDREAKEGGIFSYISQDNKTAVLVELSCETDFVAKNDAFKELGSKLAQQIANASVIDETIINAEKSDLVRESISKLGENMTIGRFEKFTVSNTGGVYSYVHHNSKIGVLVELSCKNTTTTSNDLLKELGRNIAMHTAAAAPTYLNPSEVSPEAINNEKEVQRKILLEEGKNDAVIDKIMEGKIKKYISEVTLLEQAYIREPKLSINDLLKDANTKLNDTITIVRFKRFAI